MKRQSFWVAAGIVVAATLGAGIFSLPYVFREAGWLIGLTYLAVLAPAIIFAHVLYYRAIERTEEKNRLLGLVRKNFGKFYFGLALISIIGGLLLGLLGELILGGKFIALILPSVGVWSVLIFWLLGSLPMLFGTKRFAAVEVSGAITVLLLAALMFITSGAKGGLFAGQTIQVKNIFLPFGAVLFALAGWTAVEPVFDFVKRKAVTVRPTAIFAAATAITAIIYLLFVLGVFGSGGSIAPDTISGILGWAAWRKILLFALGILALLGIYRPVVLEVKNSLVSDLRLSGFWGYLVALGVPLTLYFLGLTSFLRVVALAGGVFLSLQYFFIIFVSQKVLALKGVRRCAALGVAGLFMLGAVYELYYFIVK
jgi:amino acid permease